MFKVLSYPLRYDDPVWPGNPPPVQVKPFQSINMGDNVNTTILHLFSHSGTHIDTPKHFNDNGPSAIDLPIESYIFFKPKVLNVHKPEGGFIYRQDLEIHEKKLADCDIALLYTGWSSIRSKDPVRYVWKGPLLHPEAAQFIIDNFPDLRAIAIDAVSIGSPSYEKESIDTHKILTGVGRKDGRFILIIEDLLIYPELDRATRIYAWPLIIDGSDGSPCTVVAEFEDRE